MQVIYRFLSCLPILCLLWIGQSHAASGDVALITALDGQVNLVAASGRQPMQAFMKLKAGDMLALDGGAHVQVVFFESKRQENWGGGGRLEIMADQGKGWGLPEPQVKVLPAVLVKQISKTPALDSQGRAGAVRLRAIATTEALAKLDDDYKRMRMETVRDDLNPEMFLFASLLEMRQYDRLEQAMAELKTSHPGNMEAGVLISLYQKTLKNMRESGK